jgi:hypothetical protein
MSIGDSRCDTCQSKERQPWAGIVGAARVCLCRKCIGSLVAACIKWIKDFDRLHPPVKRPKNPAKPIVDKHGTVRCRECHMQMPDWTVGDAPLCEACGGMP